MPPTPSATYQRLRDTIAKRMRMSHVYQPLMLMELLGRRSPAPAQDVTRRILGKDVTQITISTERVKRMLGKVHLQRHLPLWQGCLLTDQRLGEDPGGHKGQGPLRVLRCARTPARSGSGPHHPQEPGRPRRNQQLAGPLPTLLPSDFRVSSVNTGRFWVSPDQAIRSSPPQ